MTQNVALREPAEGRRAEARPGTANPPLQQPVAAPLGDIGAWTVAPVGQQATNALIMMVDDEPTTTEVLQMFLEDHGYSRFAALNDSRLALDTVRERQPDVLLLDLMMPDVDGFEILAAMREAGLLETTPVIMLTSSVDAATKLRALELGATDFLGKPVDPSELALRLRNTLRAKAHQDRLAFYDALTGLPNRNMFQRRLERALACAAENERACAVLHFDLDRFQNVNESLGHGMGDMVLKAVAQRLESVMLLGERTLSRAALEDPFVARLGGDEFAIVLPDLDDTDIVVEVAERLRDSFRQAFVVGRDELFVSSAIGVSVSPYDGARGDELLQKATAATAHAKQSGLREHQFYFAGLNERVSERLRLENLLHKAVEREQLELAYQPKISLQTGKVIGAEALLRWNLPESGYVSPAEFIPIAEESGLILNIGRCVMEQAVRQLADWARDGHDQLNLSVNVSALQFRDPAFLDNVHSVLASSGVNPHNLTIELTESALMDQAVEVEAALEQIRAAGPRISVDDFGTGYSSLTYLKRFAIDELKIDRSFLHNVPADEGNCAIVKTVIGLAHGLKLHVVAEGVEDDAQLAFLRAHGCHVFQGFIASKAVDTRRFTTFIEIAAEHGWPTAAGRESATG